MKRAAASAPDRDAVPLAPWPAAAWRAWRAAPPAVPLAPLLAEAVNLLYEAAKAELEGMTSAEPPAGGPEA